MNTLYYGDNLKILREYIKDETVDLVYLDPPFNSNRSYNVLFKDESGKEADAQITAFEDTWHWTQSAEATYHELLMQADAVSKMIEAFRGFVGTNQMLAYLVMMTARLVELHRVLKPTGSLYLHCFTPETPVRMANGEYKPICAVNLDDVVVSESGVNGSVENCLSKHFSGELMQFFLAGIPLPIKCTPEHRIFVLKKEVVQRLRRHWSDNSRFARGVTQWETRRPRGDEFHYAAQEEKIEAGELRIGDFCLVPIDREVWQDEWLDVPTSTHRNSKKVPDRVKIDENLAELCGYYLAEGNTRYGYTNWTFHERENELVRRVEFLSREVFGLDTIRINLSGKKAQRITVCSVAVAAFFEKHFGTGSGCKKLPLALQKAPLDVQKALIGAWANGDGWIDRKNRGKAVLRVSTTSYGLAMQMQQVALRLGAAATVGIGNRPHYRPQDKANVCYRLQIIESYFGSAGLSTTIGDKENNLKRCFILGDWFCVPVRKIEKSFYDGEVFDLHIEPQHSYCAGGIKVSNCDPTASHYLKILLDTIFGALNYRSEIIWKRTSSHNSAKRFGPIHDTIFFYSKTDAFVWNKVFQAYDKDYIETFYRHWENGKRYQLVDLTGSGIRTGESGKPWRDVDPTDGGRHWAVPNEILSTLTDDFSTFTTQQKLDLLDNKNFIYWTKNGKPRLKKFLEENTGVPVQDVIEDIQPLSSHDAERLGYPTQKPVALLERIVQASSNEGDVVLDPFCGCGTTIAAAQKLNRRWIGIDVTHLSIALQKYRLKDAFGLEPKGKKSELPASAGSKASPNVTTAGAKNQPPAHAGSSDTYQIIGEPEDLHSAQQLALEDRYQFQWWALSLIKARPLGASAGSKAGKKGSDKGIDGVIVFTDDNSGKAKRVLVQVKSGKVKSGDIRDLVGTITREDAAIGVFITLEDASRDMITEAVSQGFYHSDGWHRDFPKMQILSIEDLLNGKEVQMPPGSITFKQAERIKQSDEQHKLF